MKNKYLLIIVLLVVSAGLLIIYLSDNCPFFNYIKKGNNSETVEGTEIGDQAPSFTLAGLDGREIKLKSYRGKKVFLNFWATWCSPCRIEMPAIQELYNKNDDIIILAINLREKKGEVAEFMMLNGYTFKTLLDTEGKIANKYLVRGIPTSYALDENGIIIGKHTGTMNYSQMLELLELK